MLTAVGSGLDLKELELVFNGDEDFLLRGGGSWNLSVRSGCHGRSRLAPDNEVTMSFEVEGDSRAADGPTEGCAV
jgi:hypothetical protein